jgi:hypothetical protein
VTLSTAADDDSFLFKLDFAAGCKSMSMKKIGFLMVLVALSLPSVQAQTDRSAAESASDAADSPQTIRPSTVRLNQIQVIGTHNSYHLQPHPAVMAIIRQAAGAQADAIAYSHRPLHEQFSELGIRQIELDVYADPEGGHYANPLALQMIAQSKLPADQLPSMLDFDPLGEMKQPGLKVIHAPDVDFMTTVKSFVAALREVKEWSDQHPKHLPIMILVEAKQDQLLPILTKPLPFDAVALDTIDNEIKAVFPLDRVITPDSIRGDFPTLREALAEHGWPRLDDVRGKVIFALDNGGQLRDDYLANHPSLTGRMLFVSVGAEHPAAAFIKLNDPIADFDLIQESVRRGLLVRTRADANTTHARRNDVTMRDHALASGAQFISTDHPEPNLQWSEYFVQLPGGGIARSNPINGDGQSIETIAPAADRSNITTEKE